MDETFFELIQCRFWLARLRTAVHRLKQPIGTDVKRFLCLVLIGLICYVGHSIIVACSCYNAEIKEKWITLKIKVYSRLCDGINIVGTLNKMEFLIIDWTLALYMYRKLFILFYRPVENSFLQNSLDWSLLLVSLVKVQYTRIIDKIYPMFYLSLLNSCAHQGSTRFAQFSLSRQNARVTIQ